MAEQLHKKFTDDQIKLLFGLYVKKEITTEQVVNQLGCKKRRFYQLLNQYRHAPDTFSIAYDRQRSNHRLSSTIDDIIREELQKDRKLIINKDIPITTYNYTAIRDQITPRIKRSLSAQTVRNRAKAWGYYTPPQDKKKALRRHVITEAPGMLLQHDSSHHKWSPYVEKAWILITTLEDYSRLLLYADFHEVETTWAHIQALEQVVLTYGVGLAYYVDSHSIFRFVCHQDSTCYRQIKGTDEVYTQWKTAVTKCGMQVWHALSPQAKGKVERPYRWLQDRVVRRCAHEHITNIDDGRYILRQEVSRYNEHQVHSTTGEIPLLRLEHAVAKGNCCFRELQLPAPYTSTKDIFCLSQTRIVDGYNCITWKAEPIALPVPLVPGTSVDLHIIPYEERIEIRIWYKNNLLQVIHSKK